MNVTWPCDCASCRAVLTDADGPRPPCEHGKQWAVMDGGSLHRIGPLAAAEHQRRLRGRRKTAAALTTP